MPGVLSDEKQRRDDPSVLRLWCAQVTLLVVVVRRRVKEMVARAPGRESPSSVVSCPRRVRGTRTVPPIVDGTADTRRHLRSEVSHGTRIPPLALGGPGRARIGSRSEFHALVLPGVHFHHWRPRETPNTTPSVPPVTHENEHLEPSRDELDEAGVDNAGGGSRSDEGGRATFVAEAGGDGTGTAREFSPAGAGRTSTVGRAQRFQRRRSKRVSRAVAPKGASSLAPHSQVDPGGR